MVANGSLSASARRRRSLVSRALACLERFQYHELEVPLLAPWDDLAPVLDADAEATLYRFVDHGGRLVVLRGDLTPVVARQIARLQGRAEGASRVSYANRVARRQRGLAADRTEAYEVGCELMGPHGLGADLEVAALALHLLALLDVDRAELHLGDVRISDAILTAAFRAPRDVQAARDALDLRDPDDLHALASGASVAPALADALHALCALLPGERELEVLERTRIDVVQQAVADLRARQAALAELQPEATVRLDLGMRDDRGYYTGMRFRLQAGGHGELLGGGGRYDRLLAHFGVERPAAGFSLRLDRIVDLSSSVLDRAEEQPAVVTGQDDVSRVADAFARVRAGQAVRLDHDEEAP